MSKLILNLDQAARIGREGAEAYPHECCGVMIGRDVGEVRVVEQLQALANAFDPSERYHRFRLDPLELARVDKQAGEQGKSVLGFYHSHPDAPARPSEYDRQHAWPFYSYVIVAIEKGQARDMTSWQLDESTEQFVSQIIVPSHEMEVRP